MSDEAQAQEPSMQGGGLWCCPSMYERPLGVVAAAWGQAAPPAASGPEAEPSTRKSKFERAVRTGRETGMVTLFFNVGRKQLVTPADVVGKIAGVTRLPADVVGAIDIHQRHLLVDVKEEHAALIGKKLTGIRLKGQLLAPALASESDREAE